MTELSMPARKRVILMRHGEVRYFDVDGRLVDPRTVTLTENGKVQAAAAADMLTGYHFDRALCSSAPRTQETAAFVLAGDLVAGTHREPAEPGVPGVRITERPHMAPRQEEGVLHRIVCAIGIAQDQEGDAEQTGMRCMDQLRVRIEIPVHRPFDQHALHGRHRVRREDRLRARTQ